MKNNTDADIFFAVLDLVYRIKLKFLNHLSENNQFPIGIDANWVSPANHHIPHVSLSDWLLNTGSLTERLQALTSSFEVEVIGQATMRANKSEQSALPQYDEQAWQIREVILSGDGKPWVYARSVLPEHLCQTTWATLGNQPLGQRIFNDDKFVRSEFSITKLTKNPIDPDSKLQQPLWGRRSTFKVHDWHLLVAEVFLPECPCYLPESIRA